MSNKAALLQGSCLCGDVTYESAQDHSEMWNCHCHECRKASSVAYAVWIKTLPVSFSWLSVKSPVSIRYSSATMLRSFCSRCGSVLPAYSEKDNSIFLPASGITTEHKLEPSADLFTNEMPPWYETGDHPSSHSSPSLSGCQHTQNEGSCLCGAVSYRIKGKTDAIRACHCSRCRQRSGSAWFSAMPVLFSEFQIVGDEENMTSFFLPGSQYYGYSFCRTCGTVIPGIFPDGKRTVIAAGSLDSTPAVGLKYHIYYKFRAPWTNLNALEECFSEHPPAEFL